ncbi:MAG: RNA polymerase sigma factor [Salibacteraceae bacterium]
MSTIEFNQALNEFKNPLHFFALKLTSNEEDAKDLVQETYLKALTYKEKLLTKASLKGWLYTIMKNTFINQYRRSVKYTGIVDKMKHQEYVTTRSSEISLSPDKIMSTDYLNAAIDKLDVGYRIPFKMKLEGYKYAEIGEHINIPIGTVKSRIFLARKKLSEQLPEYTV